MNVARLLIVVVVALAFAAAVIHLRRDGEDWETIFLIIIPGTVASMIALAAAAAVAVAAPVALVYLVHQWVMG